MNIDLTNVFIQLLMLFALMAIGYVIKSIKMVDGSFDRTLSKVVLSVTMPCMILASVLNADSLPSRSEILLTLVLSFALYLLMIVVAEILVRIMGLKSGRRGVYRFMCVFGNVGFIGFPVISAFFGPEAIIYAAVFNIPFNVLVFTLGVLWLASDGTDENGERKKVNITARMFLTPCVIACVLVIILCVVGVHSVPVLGPFAKLVGDMTTPAALIIIGSNLANLPVRDLLGTWRLYVTAVIRLCVMPLVAWLVFHFFVANPTLLGIMVVVCAMPVATNGTLLCFQYGGDMKSMSQTTFISTILSFVSIPLLAMFLSIVG